MSAVTHQSIDNRIDSVSYLRIADTTVTVCLIKMVNGYTVLGQSACVNPDDFDQGAGERYAYEDALNKIWPLEGYLAAERRLDELRKDKRLSTARCVENKSTHDQFLWLCSSCPMGRFSTQEKEFLYRIRNAHQNYDRNDQQTIAFMFAKYYKEAA